MIAVILGLEFEFSVTVGVLVVALNENVPLDANPDVPVAGANHQRVVTPTGKVYVACDTYLKYGCGINQRV